MPVLSPVLNRNNSIGYSVGLKFKLKQVFKDGDKTEVKLITTAEENVFCGLFDEKDMDFEIIVQNYGLNNMAFEVNVPNSGPKRYYIKAGMLAKLRALKTKGKHLHFLSQSTEEGKILVGMSAQENRTSYEEAAVNCSRIGFSAQVEKTPDRPNNFALMHSTKGQEFDIVVKTFGGKSIQIPGVKVDWTVFMIKDWIENNEHIPYDQQTIYVKGHPPSVQDYESLGDLGLVNGSVFYLHLRFKGGGTALEPPEFDERGVVCFGKQTDQRFGSYKGFEASEKFDIKPFTIELRMKSKYSLSEINERFV